MKFVHLVRNIPKPKIITPITLLLLILTSCTPQPRITQRTNTPFKNVTFHKCYDGDTCTVSLPGVNPLFGKKINVRIRGIDTPEIRGKCKSEKKQAKAAKRYINKLLSKAKHIDLVNPARGKYFRIVAGIKADDVDVGKLMLEKGFARSCDGGTRGKWCE